ATGGSVGGASTEPATLGPFPLQSGFVLFRPGSVANDVAYDPDGRVVSSTTTAGGVFGVAANGGSFVVACDGDGTSTPARKFELHRYDDTNAEVGVTTWTDDNAGRCPIHGSASLIDTEARLLVLHATRA